MLVACILAPFFMAIAFKFFIPLLENFLCSYFSSCKILFPFYILFDLMLSIMTPILFCFAGVLVILEEEDCSVAPYCAVTPLGKSGYLISRIGVLTFFSLFYNIALLHFFALSSLDFFDILILSLSGVLNAIFSSMFVLSFAKNKMEGLALVKMCGLLLIGLPIAYFVKSNVKYVFSFFPTFWIAEFCITEKYLFFFVSVGVSVLWIWVLWAHFKKKIL